MVRFSDLLGGQETPEDKPEHNAVAEAPVAPEEEAIPPELAEEVTDELPEPEDVLERLTQYATSARAADQTPTPEAIVEPPSPESDPESAPLTDPEPADAAASLAPVADDLLPRSKGKRRS